MGSVYRLELERYKRFYAMRATDPELARRRAAADREAARLRAEADRYIDTSPDREAARMRAEQWRSAAADRRRSIEKKWRKPHHPPDREYWELVDYFVAKEEEEFAQRDAEEERQRVSKFHMWASLGVRLDQEDFECNSFHLQAVGQNCNLDEAVDILGGLLEVGLAEPLPEVSARVVSDYEAGDSAAIAAYIEAVLAGFIEAVLADVVLLREHQPKQVKVAYIPESRQVVVEYELPPVDVVPRVKSYRYVKKSDKVVATARPASQIKALYAGFIAHLTLLCLAKIFEADRARHIDVAVFNGVVDSRDPRSGRPSRPCLITVRVTRATFEELDLNHVDPTACLKHLSAGVSKSPTELVPVRPVLEFSMVDPRFIAETDAVRSLDDRPNLLDLTFREFESLVQNLFTSMGLEARQTRPSRDGGVDCIAYNTQPILGGKVVIQAKRYKNTVGVSAVRDLYGTLQNEGASKGILVTTSGYGAASFDFAKNKPIELIDGANLLYLLKEHLDITARIEPPDDWQDPVPDSGIHPFEDA